jgi:hypothetical protein
LLLASFVLGCSVCRIAIIKARALVQLRNALRRQSEDRWESRVSFLRHSASLEAKDPCFQSIACATKRFGDDVTREGGSGHGLREKLQDRLE